VKKTGRVSFDPKIFLAKVGGGTTVTKYQKDQIVFSREEVADAVFLHPARQDKTRRRF
jgi:CRP/FNR family transcriptional regulator, cyclic AMP receptor protein